MASFKFLGAILATLFFTPFTQALAATPKDAFPAIPDLYSERNHPVPAEMLTLFNITHENHSRRNTLDERSSLEKRLTIYQCGRFSQFVKATCDDHNNLVTWCTVPANSRRTGANNPPGSARIESYFNCQNLICWPGYLGNNPEKAACISVYRTESEYLPVGGARRCIGLNRPEKQNAQVRVETLIFRDVGKHVGYAPAQITLTDGPDALVQAVGPADMAGGRFFSKFFKYIGGIKECVQTASHFDTPATTFFSIIL